MKKIIMFLLVVIMSLPLIAKVERNKKHNNSNSSTIHEAKIKVLELKKIINELEADYGSYAALRKENMKLKQELRAYKNNKNSYLKLGKENKRLKEENLILEDENQDLKRTIKKLEQELNAYKNNKKLKKIERN